MKQPLRQQAYEYVLQRIISGEFTPGMQLSETRLAREIGISPTPLREAYRQLAGEGLVEHRPHTGAFVRTFSVDEIRDLYELREVVEARCAAKATQLMNKKQTDQLEDLNATMRTVTAEASASARMPREFLEADWLFHSMILESSGNAAFLRVMREYQALAKIMLVNRYPHTPEQTSAALDQHEEITEAIKNHDPARAESSMKAHIEFSRNGVLDALGDSLCFSLDPRPATSD